MTKSIVFVTTAALFCTSSWAAHTPPPDMKGFFVHGLEREIEIVVRPADADGVAITRERAMRIVRKYADDENRDCAIRSMQWNANAPGWAFWVHCNVAVWPDTVGKQK